MESRLSKYNEPLDKNPKKSTRMGKNQYLYDEINNRIGYEEITSLDTQTKIDLSSIRNSSTRENYQKTKDYRDILDKTENENKPEIDSIPVKQEPKVYDINSILENARKNRLEPDELERKRKPKEETAEILQKMVTGEIPKVKNEIDEDELTGLINTITS